jgi:flagellum-specific peptidoglycan hydrolase FlgJ
VGKKLWIYGGLGAAALAVGGIILRAVTKSNKAPSTPVPSTLPDGKNTKAIIVPNNRQGFVKGLATAAIAVSKDAGVPWQVCVAQGILETGWGEYYSNNNVFGIKGVGDAGTFGAKTSEEYTVGKPVQITDSFAAYSSLGSAILAWAKFVKGPLYRFASEHYNNDPAKFAVYIWGVGYATDSKYPAKLASISRTVEKEYGIIGAGFDFSPSLASIVAELSALDPISADKKSFPRRQATKRLMEVGQGVV